MFQFLPPLILIIASVGLFLGYTKPQYVELKDLRTEASKYDSALEKSKELLKKRDSLLDVRNTISEGDIDKLKKLLPSDVNSTKVILELQNLAVNKHGLLFENPKYDPNKKTTAPSVSPDQGSSNTQSKDTQQAVAPKDAAQQVPKDYGTFELEFTIIGPYEKFIAFIQDLEKSLRIIDIQSITITPKDGSSALKYTVKVQTYWLKS